ncbi:MAG TPA: hemoblobin-interacting domain-containing protein, partial [Verrucomicrobiae bacterium]|nr:hemoblobin-interacting domain-containing protein [Verrucomicrobiae bacterium]
STSVGGSQARAACSPDNLNFLICDKGGLYVDSSLVYQENNLATRSFGGAAWVETAKAAFPAVASLFQFANASFGGNDIDWGNPGDNGPIINSTFTPPQDPLAQDFYMITTNGGTTYSILYVLEQSGGTNGASGVINKWSLNSDGFTWIAIGAYTNGDNSDTLFATTNGAGGVYLYYADGSGGTGGNSLIRLTDATVNGPLNIISSNAIYTASANTSIEGVTFVPEQIAYTNQLILPPLLTAQSFVGTNGYGLFAITNTPDDPLWRSSITAVTVNGSPLPSAAYTTNTIGEIVFDPSQSALLQTPGVITIGISASGYSSNAINQLLVGAPAKLVISTQPKAPTADGSVLATQPSVLVEDQDGNTVVSATPSIVAQVGAGTWTIGGTTTKTASSGKATFSGLTAFGNSAVTGATISFTSSGLTAVTSSTFNIPAPIKSLLGGANAGSGKFSFAFTNITGLSFSVLATNNVTAPVSTWPVVGTVIESPTGSGKYSFTNSAATNSQLFYILRQP